jgi:predicted nucleic acid-binding Zn ribbon protein
LQDEEANALPHDATQSEEPVQECSNQQDTSSDDDEMTIVTLDHNDQNAAAFAWLDQNGPKMERRCRNVLLRELQRVQRASFMHFMLLCLIPTALLLVVVVTVFGEEEPCGSQLATCRQEATMHSP